MTGHYEAKVSQVSCAEGVVDNVHPGQAPLSVCGTSTNVVDAGLRPDFQEVSTLELNAAIEGQADSGSYVRPPAVFNLQISLESSTSLPGHCQPRGLYVK